MLERAYTRTKTSGVGYKVVMTHLKKQQMPSPTCPQLLQKIVTALFPQQRSFDYQLEPGELDDIPPVTEEELLEACNRAGNNKAPGLDGIPNIALKTIIKAAPSLFLEAYNSCLKEAFPRKWKATIDAVVDPLLADNQYGFRKGRSTLDAISLVVNTAKEAIAGTRWKGGAKKYCLVAALDIRNAFNSANWDCIMQALDEKNVPAYLRRLVVSYFTDRVLKYDTKNGPKNDVTGGVPRSSVLVTSVLTYGISIWADALEKQDSWRKAGPIYRMSALRVASAFRTVSEEAVCVISGTLPLRVLAKEDGTFTIERRQPHRALKNSG
ncbi:hypothetical protein EVAR_65488_1 [Eumeta japonica]|uniref:Reverse transcriptase domain-containing protein n=1 Tax=Eumeta variegata TaxID=151549 RepID=A0A4C2A3K2_EUMVA|nr:hypothetical protein EVAR_65488_1 [Eumeta japonica]